MFFTSNPIQDGALIILIIIAERSASPFVGLKMFSVFAFLTDFVPNDSGGRNFRIRLKFGIKAYALCEISCIIFDVHCQTACVQEYTKSISIWRMEDNYF